MNKIYLSSTVSPHFVHERFNIKTESLSAPEVNMVVYRILLYYDYLPPSDSTRSRVFYYYYLTSNSRIKFLVTHCARRFTDGGAFKHDIMSKSRQPKYHRHQPKSKIFSFSKTAVDKSIAGYYNIDNRRYTVTPVHGDDRFIDVR